MTRHGPSIFIALLLAWLPVHAGVKGADGIVILKGTLEDPTANAEALTFAFTGSLSFTFQTVGPWRTGVTSAQDHLEISVTQLAVRIPFFGAHQYDQEEDPYRVTYKMAVKNALDASRLQGSVTVALSVPKLSFDYVGFIQRIDCEGAQVMPNRLERALRQGRPPAS